MWKQSVDLHAGGRSLPHHPFRAFEYPSGSYWEKVSQPGQPLQIRYEPLRLGSYDAEVTVTFSCVINLSGKL